MITLDQYFGPWLHHKDATENVMDNAESLLEQVSQLMALAAESFIPMPINDVTGSQVSGEKYGGFRPQSCTIGAKTSAHKLGMAVDIFDPDNQIDDWVTDEILEECGLYREHPTATHGWCHLTIRRPGSGNRTFLP